MSDKTTITDFGDCPDCGGNDIAWSARKKDHGTAFCRKCGYVFRIEDELVKNLDNAMTEHFGYNPCSTVKCGVPGKGVKIPSSVKIGHLTIKVVLNKDLITERSNFGEYSPKFQEIRIDEEVLPDKKFSTFIHELVEAVNSIYFMEMNHDHIQILGVALAQALGPMLGKK